LLNITTTAPATQLLRRSGYLWMSKKTRMSRRLLYRLLNSHQLSHRMISHRSFEDNIVGAKHCCDTIHIIIITLWHRYRSSTTVQYAITMCRRRFRVAQYHNITPAAPYVFVYFFFSFFVYFSFTLNLTEDRRTFCRLHINHISTLSYNYYKYP